MNADRKAKRPASKPAATKGGATRKSATKAKPKPAGPTRRFPDWYPPWAEELARLYFSGTSALFVIHGNVHDLVWCEDGPGGAASYIGVPEFLATRVFGTWDVVLQYDLGQGLRPLAGDEPERLRSMIRLTGALGDPSGWPSGPERVLPALEGLLRQVLIREPGGQAAAGATDPASVALLFPHAEYLVPTADISSLSASHGSRLVRLLGWARNPYVKRQNIAICLIADRLSEVDSRLVQNPHVAAVEIPMPTGADRVRFIRTTTGSEREFRKESTFTAEELAQVSNGLTLVNLNVVLGQARSGGGRVGAETFRRLKKDMIERQTAGLLEFYEPSHRLDMVVGHEAAKDRLRQDAALIEKGRLEFAPMGYLICGPVGTGKTFLAECYAGSVGIPCVKLKNFRSKYVGETEGNLELVLNVLRSLGPVVVLVDEADAALGTREASGDSGTSSRVFSMIASQMGDTRYRGRIVWMLLTSRPDRLPVDLKRQGRAEVHIPLFYPVEEGEFRLMFKVMAKKNRVALPADSFAHLEVGDGRLSGSDIEGVVLGANRLALNAGRTEVTREDLDLALADFIPSAEGLEREAQELAAVIECTQKSFLPDRWRKQVDMPNGRAAVQERLAAIRQILSE